MYIYIYINLVPYVTHTNYMFKNRTFSKILLFVFFLNSQGYSTTQNINSNSFAFKQIYII